MQPYHRHGSRAWSLSRELASALLARELTSRVRLWHRLAQAQALAKVAAAPTPLRSARCWQKSCESAEDSRLLGPAQEHRCVGRIATSLRGRGAWGFALAGPLVLLLVLLDLSACARVPTTARVAAGASVVLADAAIAPTADATAAADSNSGPHDAQPADAAEDTAVLAVDGGCPADSPTCTRAVPEGMVWIRAGYFWMGCAADSCQYVPDQHPVHLVWLDGYALDLFETTVADYAKCVDAGGCSVPAAWSSQKARQYLNWGAPDDRSNHPVNGITWLQGKAYCAWRGKRLPTEAEWEKAARGGCATADTPACLAQARNYPWGNEPPTCDRVVGNTYDVQPNGEPGCGGPLGTRPVGSKPAGRSPYGVWDMAGNIGEIVSDWYDSYYYEVSPLANPTGPLASYNIRPWRGWHSGGTFALAAGFSVSMRFQSEDLAGPTDEVPGLTWGVRCAK